jgi:hypothetical protein
MAYDTLLQQGKFTSDGTFKTIPLRGDVDSMWVYNFSQSAAQNNLVIAAYWQRGMLDGSGLAFFKSGGADTMEVNILVPPFGFSLVDSTASPVGAQVAVTGTTNNIAPTVTAASVVGLFDGSVVRLDSLDNNLTNLSGFDFEITNVNSGAGTFDMKYPLYNIPNAVATAGFYRQIKFQPMFYPRNRVINAVIRGATTTIFFTVTHGYTVGQELRFSVTSDFGIIELNGLIGTVLAVDLALNSVTVNIDSSAFTAFQWPLAAAGLNFTFPQAVPMGEDTGYALSTNNNILDDATINTGFIGMQIGGGANTPCGAATDIIYWTAAKAFSVDNQ